MPNDPEGTLISATILLVAGSTRASVPFLSIISQTLPAPVAIPPSESPIVIGTVAVIALVLRSRRDIVWSPQFGTHQLPKPPASPEQGCLPAPSAIVVAVAVFGSSRDTLSFGSFDTHAASSIASQSGCPPTWYTASGFRRSIGIFTPGVFTPGRGGRAGGCASSAVPSSAESAMLVTVLYMGWVHNSPR